MKQKFLIIVQPKDIIVTFNGLFLLRQTRLNELSLYGNVKAAIVEAERIVKEMAEQEKLAAQAGKKLAIGPVNKQISRTQKDTPVI